MGVNGVSGVMLLKLAFTVASLIRSLCSFYSTALRTFGKRALRVSLLNVHFWKAIIAQYLQNADNYIL